MLKNHCVHRKLYTNICKHTCITVLYKHTQNIVYMCVCVYTYTCIYIYIYNVYAYIRQVINITYNKYSD